MGFFLATTCADLWLERQYPTPHSLSLIIISSFLSPHPQHTASSLSIPLNNIFSLYFRNKNPLPYCTITTNHSSNFKSIQQPLLHLYTLLPNYSPYSPFITSLTPLLHPCNPTNYPYRLLKTMIPPVTTHNNPVVPISPVHKSPPLTAPQLYRYNNSLLPL